MKLLIIGCSHSVGIWKKPSVNKKQLYDSNSGWVYKIAEKYNNYQIDCISHSAGGIFNYLITIGTLGNKIKKYDKVIIQFTEETRLTIYNIKEKKDMLFYSKIKTNLNNLTRYDLLSSNKKNNLFCLHNLLLINEDLNLNLEFDQNYILNLLSGSYLSKNMINSFKFILSELFKEKLFTFEWYDMIKKINEKYGKEAYTKMISSVDNAHLDDFGNKLIFDFLEPELNKFL